MKVSCFIMKFYFLLCALFTLVSSCRNIESAIDTGKHTRSVFKGTIPFYSRPYDFRDGTPYKTRLAVSRITVTSVADTSKTDYLGSVLFKNKDKGEIRVDKDLSFLNDFMTKKKIYRSGGLGRKNRVYKHPSFLRDPIGTYNSNELALLPGLYYVNLEFTNEHIISSPVLFFDGFKFHGPEKSNWTWSDSERNKKFIGELVSKNILPNIESMRLMYRHNGTSVRRKEGFVGDTSNSKNLVRMRKANFVSTPEVSVPSLSDTNSLIAEWNNLITGYQLQTGSFADSLIMAIDQIDSLANDLNQFSFSKQMKRLVKKVDLNSRFHPLQEHSILGTLRLIQENSKTNPNSYETIYRKFIQDFKKALSRPITKEKNGFVNLSASTKSLYLAYEHRLDHLVYVTVGDQNKERGHGLTVHYSKNRGANKKCKDSRTRFCRFISEPTNNETSTTGPAVIHLGDLVEWEFWLTNNDGERIELAFPMNDDNATIVDIDFLKGKKDLKNKYFIIFIQIKDD